MTVHLAGILGLVAIFAIGTVRSINLGVLGIVMTFLVGSLFGGEPAREMLSGFPIDLFVLLTGVTYLFGIAASNGTVERIVDGTVRLVGDRRRLIPWMVFGVAAAPAMAGAIGSAGVAMLAPLAMRLAERCELDRRMIGLMVVHGAAAGNFSPLNVLGAIVLQAMQARGLDMSAQVLFVGNLIYNIVLGLIIVAVFGRRRVPATGTVVRQGAFEGAPRDGLTAAQISTIAALLAVAIAALMFGLAIGPAAFTAAILLQLVFPRSGSGAEKHIAWGVVLLVCGVVTYVGALQRYGTVDAAGTWIAALGNVHVVGLLLCYVGAITSAFASSAGILSALIPLAIPFIAQGSVGPTGMVVAMAVSATVVDATPFSTVGALAVANASEGERQRVYQGMLRWGAAMVVTAPLVTWLIFILPAS
jgi:di/tricarboxylate transporter